MTVEHAVTFGPDGGIMGIVSHPATTDLRSRQRAVLLSNVGLHHHVGPFRMYVDLARALAAEGWWALRFDQLGMGESAPRPHPAAGVAEESQDVTSAMDYMRDAHGVTEFVLIALCSGVDTAHVAAVRDARVRGAVFIDGYTYATPGFRWRRTVLRWLQAGRWQRFMNRQVSRRDLDVPKQPATRALFDRVYPSREQFRRDMAIMAARSVHTYFVYTGTVDQSFNAEKQMFEIVGADVPRTLVSVSRLPTADHVFSNVAARRDLQERICAWARRIQT